MAFKITAEFNEHSINHVFGQWSEYLENVIISRLKFVGETFIQNARNNNTYHDKTGNLRSSIGYVVAKNGEIVVSSFQRSSTATTDEGVVKARELAQSIVDEYPRGFVFVGVAGMDYAAAVEANGYDVITNSSITAKNDLIEAIASLQNKLG